jgi:hypothetical protein
LSLSKSKYIGIRVDRYVEGGGSKQIVRVLVSIAPLSYREAVALSLTKHRPHLETRIVPPEDLDQEAESFEPHLVVCNEVTQTVRENVPSWVQILLEDGLDAVVSVNGQSLEVHDISTEDLLGALDETEEMASRG